MTYKAVNRLMRSTIASVVKAVTGVESVIIGEKWPVDYFPMALVIPGPIDINPDSNESDLHLFTYFVAVVDETGNVSTGLQSTIDVAADIYDALTVDHTLNGVCDDLFVNRIDPRYYVEQTYERHWVLIQMRLQKQIGR